MTTTTAGSLPASSERAGSTAHPTRSPWELGATVRTARVTGLWYLGLAATGMLGFLVLRPLVIGAEPSATVAHLTARPELAHSLVLVELAIVLTQTLAAVWFYALLRPLHPVAAFATATSGLVNAVAIMMSAAFLAVANAVVADPVLGPGGDVAGVVGLLTELSSGSWAVGGVFFGLWLVPMGWVAITTRRFPVLLGWLLVVGGAGYVLSALLGLGVPGVPAGLSDALAYPATAGELWMVGYLLAKGIRR